MRLAIECEEPSLCHQPPSVLQAGGKLWCEARFRRRGQSQDGVDRRVMGIRIAQELTRGVAAACSAEQGDVTFSVAGQPVKLETKDLLGRLHLLGTG